MSSPQHCLSLLADLPGYFPVGGGCENAWIDTEPTKIMGSLESGMALMAQSLTGRGVEMNMRRPAVVRLLNELARCGEGHEGEFEGVRFMFVGLAEGREGVRNGVDEL
ncbi:hypothetical protein P154DRAFT_609659 [Amniculicola lignicola CBS 123094]|uniref:Uncharacterized protein n=1 Tax=Amniculicola lignicola CBS 123094 TaxID=1392246 RepID=A0A6A5W222_9PLEO|nr:hypothetical protein P154DRAFT_609659 [Amniculicola lignicola CBS 123094]